ncbi:MAG: M17 family peptidase N-terminal domain-containing protein, partial [Candidatus Omnitrophota bacterium]
MISFISNLSLKKGYGIILLTSEQVKGGVFNCFTKDISTAVHDVLKSERFEGSKGEVFPVVIGKDAVVLLGLGKEKDLSLTSLRGLVRSVLLSAFFKKASDIEILPHTSSFEVVSAIIEAKIIGTYAWKKYISRKKDDKTIDNKTIHIVADKDVRHNQVIKAAEASNLTRNLVNENADVTTAEYLADITRGLVKGSRHIDLEVLDRAKLKTKKFGLLLAVNKGSSQEPRVVVVRYNGGKKNEPYTAIIGKGLTFDSGGLNLKPSGSMETMRSDMSGAAAVIGTLKATLDLKIKKNVIFAFG